MNVIDIHWPIAPANLHPEGREVHVFAFPLAQYPSVLEACRAVLSPEELTLAARFRFERDQTGYAVGRGVTRLVLGRMLGMHPAELVLAYGPLGKPYLAPGKHPAYWHFNLSHSHGLALLAVTRLGEVGVDVEQVRPIREMLGIARRFFSECEQAALAALPEVEVPVGFFNLWTRKEAWLKATGTGIGGGLEGVEVSLAPGEPARLLSLFGDPVAAQEWSLQALAPAAGFPAAVAVRAPAVEVHGWRWQFPA